MGYITIAYGVSFLLIFLFVVFTIMNYRKAVNHSKRSDETKA